MEVKKEAENDTLDYAIVKEEYYIDEKPSIPKQEKEQSLDIPDVKETIKFEITEIEQNSLPESEDKTFSCSQCFKSYGSKKALNRHSKIHSENASFPCAVCQKCFKTVSYLRNHMIIHGERRHACEICGKKFIDRSHVKRHIRQMHENKRRVKKDYICQDCGKVLRDKCRYRHHLRVHEEKTIQCPECPLKFKYQHNLAKHRAVHSSSKPFECPHCPRKFKSKAVLVNHMRIHDKGSALLACDICSMTFQWKRNLRKHMQEHSSAKECVPCPHCCKNLWQKHLEMHIRKMHRDLCLVDSGPPLVIKKEKK
ncbi:gastrula zinc finger protein XlCGF7.1-like [Phlebotomus argentipes]|uniref:gastrula zinc finger protein XlCGF7.1-like n=1 Tax=Phlebotomus argentipes TaxID=94469 RepID=UPI0028931546|nr:gastrula zinc finger protein XlCGF7.1-like [Phlebotomus argentipes]